MSEGYNFFLTTKYKSNIPIYYGYSVAAGIFLFRVIETYLFKNQRSCTKYFTRTLFRHLMFIRMMLKIIATIVEFTDPTFQKYYQVWMTFLYNCILIISTVCLEKSLEHYMKFLGKEARFSKLVINIFVWGYFILNTLLLLFYALASGQGHKLLGEYLYTGYIILVFIATVIFVNVPLIGIFWDIYKNGYGSSFATKVLCMMVFLIVVAVFTVIAIVIRLIYTFSLDSIIQTISSWATLLFDLTISFEQTFMDCTVEKISPTTDYAKTDDISSETASIASLPI